MDEDEVVEQYDRYLCVSKLGDRRFFLEEPTAKNFVDEQNQRSVKWYVMKYEPGLYESLVERHMDYKLVAGQVIYDPCEVSGRDLDMYYYVNKYGKRMGRKNHAE